MNWFIGRQVEYLYILKTVKQDVDHHPIHTKE